MIHTIAVILKIKGFALITKNDSQLVQSLESLPSLVQENDIEGIRQVLMQQETKLTGHSTWYYSSSQKLISKAARDAILLGHHETVQLLLDAGMSPNESAPSKKEPGVYFSLLHFAAVLGKLTMVKLLIENGAKFYRCKRDKSNTWYDNSGLRAAVSNGHADIVDYMLSRGASADGLCGGGRGGEGFENTTFLAKAAQDGQIGIVKSLIKHGADIVYSINLAYAKLYKEGYRDYKHYLEYHYGLNSRIDKFQYKFDEFSKIKSKYSAAKSLFLAKLNGLLQDLDKLEKNDAEKKNIIDYIVRELATFHIKIKDPNTLYQELDRIIDSLKEFDKKRNELKQECIEFKKSYTLIVKTLLDYSMGCDFPEKSATLFFSGKDDDLRFLGDLDVSDFCFIGCSVGGRSITRSMLIAKGIVGAEKAIFNSYDLMKITDQTRRVDISDRLRSAYQKYGELINDDGTVNLLTLYQAAKNGDIAAVKTRLAAGIDPNRDKSALVVAAENGHFEIVKLLVQAHADHTALKANKLVALAKHQVKHRLNNASLYIQEGQLKTIEPSFKSTRYLPIVMDQDHAMCMKLFERLEKGKLNDKIEAIIAKAESINHHVILVIRDDGSIKSASYECTSDKTKFKEIVKSFIQDANEYDFYPVILTDNNNFDVIEEICLSQYQEQDRSKETIVDAIVAAQKNKHLQIAEYLESQQDVNTQDKDGNTLLHRAVLSADTSRVLAILSKGADVNIKNNQGKSAIIIALSETSYCTESKILQLYMIIQHLLDRAAKVDFFTLAEAISSNCIQMLPKLLHHANQQDVLRTELMYSAARRDSAVEILKLLKEYGADLNRVDEEKGHSLLHHVVNLLPSFSYISGTMRDISRTRDNWEDGDSQNILKNTFNERIERSNKKWNHYRNLLNYLLDQGADPSIFNQIDGVTPLYALVKNKDLCFVNGSDFEELVNKLIQKGARVDAVTTSLSTVLHAAASEGNLTAASVLIKQHANVNLQDISGDTPLHVAARNCYPKMSKLLIDANADVTLVNGKGFTPLQLLDHAYKVERNELSISSNKALEEKRKESNSFYSSRNSRSEIEKMHRYYENKLSQLDTDYQETRSVIFKSQSNLNTKDATTSNQCTF